jgi:hypothetical protein
VFPVRYGLNLACASTNYAKFTKHHFETNRSIIVVVLLSEQMRVTNECSSILRKIFTDILYAP